MDFADLVNNLNNRLDELNMGTSKFQLDKIICSHPLKTTVLGYAPSIFNDQTIVPPHLRIQILSSIRNRKTVRWINKKYAEMINDLTMHRKQDYQTALVRLRIAACMSTSNNVIGLTDEEKEEWRNQINQIFYERTKVINDYYLDEIIKLPF